MLCMNATEKGEKNGKGVASRNMFLPANVLQFFLSFHGGVKDQQRTATDGKQT